MTNKTSSYISLLLLCMPVFMHPSNMARIAIDEPMARNILFFYEKEAFTKITADRLLEENKVLHSTLRKSLQEISALRKSPQKNQALDPKPESSDSDDETCNGLDLYGRPKPRRRQDKPRKSERPLKQYNKDADYFACQPLPEKPPAVYY